jgi:hypothetical protein
LLPLATDKVLPKSGSWQSGMGKKSRAGAQIHVRNRINSATMSLNAPLKSRESVLRGIRKLLISRPHRRSCPIGKGETKVHEFTKWRLRTAHAAAELISNILKARLLLPSFSHTFDGNQWFGRHLTLVSGGIHQCR